MTEYPCIWVDDGRGGQIAFPPMITQEDMETITAAFTLRPDDVFVVTYPRSGTTWTEQIVHLLLNNGQQQDDYITNVVPWLETIPHRPEGLSLLDPPAGRRAFTSHLPLAMMPDFSEENGRYIYIARNPKDVAVSYYFHDRSKGGYDGSWEEHFTLFLEGKLMFGSYFDHVLPWWQASRRAKSILFLKYEDMKRDLAAVVQEIADFLDVPADPALIERVVQGSTFKAMTQNKYTNFDWVPQREGEPKHFRKGLIGDWRNQFSVEQNRLLDELYAQKMAGSDLDFYFGDDG